MCFEAVSVTGSPVLDMEKRGEQYSSNQVKSVVMRLEGVERN